METIKLSQEKLARYARHVVIPEVELEGQHKLTTKALDSLEHLGQGGQKSGPIGQMTNQITSETAQDLAYFRGTELTLVGEAERGDQEVGQD